MIQTDALIVGAGPVGLFQVFQLGLLEISCQVVDSLPYAGGQCIELYPDKPIYDIPGVLRYTGRELVASLQQQIAPFKPALHLRQEVTAIDRQADGRFQVATSHGTQFLAKTIIIAGGVGAFQPRLLQVEGISKFADTQLFYRPDAPGKPFQGKHLLIIGGDDAAVDHAIGFAEATDARPLSVTLLHRRDVLQAEPETLARFHALREAGALRFLVGQITAFDEQAGQLAAVQIATPDGQTEAVPADALLALLGISPKLGPIAHWGLDMARKQVTVDTGQFATSVPGIFAVGDINTYPGKKKLILCGFHEAALAAFGVAALVFPDRKTPLQYTTTSPRLHQLLGVAGDNPTPTSTTAD